MICLLRIFASSSVNLWFVIVEFLLVIDLCFVDCFVFVVDCVVFCCGGVS